MKLTIKFAGASLLALALTGCLDGSNNSQNDQSSMSVDFGTFVKGEINNPDLSRDPVAVNDVTFSFNDQDDPKAFDDLLR